MDRIFVLIFASLASVFLIIAVRKFAPEYAFASSVVLGVLIAVFMLSDVSSLIETVKEFGEKTSISASWLKSILKICIISFSGQWACQICRDAGENTVADRIESAIGISITVMCLPYFRQILDIAMEIE